MKTAGKQAAFADLNPRSLGGLFNYGMAGVSGVSNFISNANQGMDFDDNLARTTGGVAGNLAGGSIGAGLGTAAAIPLAGIPVIGPALAAASPYVGSYLGSKFLGNAGTSVAGGAWDLIDKDDSYSKLGEERPIEGLGDYAQYLNPESQKALAEYMAFTDAQQGLERGQMGYLADLERQKFDHAAKTQFQNDAAMSALNAKATLEQDRQRGQMEMLMNNSNNFWNGYNSNADLMSRIYAS
jgi:hypothetical protein